MSKITVEHAGRKITVTYNTGQIGKTKEYLSSFLQRHDVAQTTTALQGLRKPHLEKKEVKARDGSIHEYAVIRKGRKRFLFDLPENPIQQQEPSSTVLVVPYQTMHEKELVPSGSGFTVFENNREARRFISRLNHEGYFAGRHTGVNVDSGHNVDFLQIVSAMVVLAKNPDERVLFAIRGQINNDSLALKTTPFPVMGHTEYSDSGHLTNIAKHALLREASEEIALKNEKTQTALHDEPIWLSALRLRRHYRIKPFGVIHREDTDVDQLHEGIVFIAEPRTSDITLILNRNSQESTQLMWQTPQEHADAIAYDKQKPASWNQPVLEALRNRRRKK